MTSDLFPEVAPRIDGDMANDRYTTRATIEWCKRTLRIGGFDLDVAACIEAHHALRWYGQQLSLTWVDGLKEPWDASRVWCNPPYDDISPWVSKAWWSMLENRDRTPMIGMLIPDNRREQPFWQRGIEPYRDGRFERHRPEHEESGWCAHAGVATDAGVRLFTHSLPGRQPFGVPGNPEGIGQQSPPFGVVLLEWRYV